MVQGKGKGPETLKQTAKTWFPGENPPVNWAGDKNREAIVVIRPMVHSAKGGGVCLQDTRIVPNKNPVYVVKKKKGSKKK